jgi:predicted RNA-binding Zn-ribbon protein involved in translation (DUF1610 family)
MGDIHYEVRGQHGKKIVSFACTECQSQLRSPLAEAGQRFPCPTCGAKLITPGAKELEQEATQQRQRDADQQKKIEQERQSGIARQEFIAAKAAREAKEKEDHDAVRRAARTNRQNNPATLIATVVFAMAVTLAATYSLYVRPAHARITNDENEISDLQRSLEKLTETVNHNADIANKNLEAILSLDRRLDTLTDTVNHNAETANFNNSLRY